MSIQFYAQTAKSVKDRKVLNRMADDAQALCEEIESMPEWAKAVAIDVRVPVSIKVEQDNLLVESHVSKRGREISLVHWSDGTTTRYEGALSKCYVKWNR